MEKIIDLLKQLSRTVDAIANELSNELKNKPTIEAKIGNRLELIDKIKSDQWPAAIPDFTLAVTEEDKLNRASDIVEAFITMEEGKKFLDFGCGDGLVAKAALKLNPSLSVGYDIVTPTLAEENGLVLTSDFEKVKTNGPYDFILLYDVLDHCENPLDALLQVREVSHKDTKVAVRCHPWCSRHGGHLYRSINKAFIHVLLTDEELLEFTDQKAESMVKVFFPFRTYQDWFEKTGFKQISTAVDVTEVDAYFYQPEIKKYFVKAWGNKTSDLPKTQMEKSFVDFVLSL